MECELWTEERDYGTFSVIMGPSYVIMGPRNVNRGPWNVIRGNAM